MPNKVDIDCGLEGFYVVHVYGPEEILKSCLEEKSTVNSLFCFSALLSLCFVKPRRKELVTVAVDGPPTLGAP